MAERAVNLTPQQLRVLLGIAEGKLNKQIAWDMAISEQTVKDHVSVILRKLGASNRTQAILLASQLALKPPPSRRRRRPRGSAFARPGEPAICRSGYSAARLARSASICARSARRAPGRTGLCSSR